VTEGFLLKFSITLRKLELPAFHRTLSFIGRPPFCFRKQRSNSFSSSFTNSGDPNGRPLWVISRRAAISSDVADAPKYARQVRKVERSRHNAISSTGSGSALRQWAAALDQR
jgi:hypothetical protein